MPVELKLSTANQVGAESKVNLIKNREEQDFLITIVFSRNGLIVRQQLKQLKDFIYLLFDLQYNNNPVISIEITQKITQPNQNTTNTTINQTTNQTTK